MCLTVHVKEIWRYLVKSMGGESPVMKKHTSRSMSGILLTALLSQFHALAEESVAGAERLGSDAIVRAFADVRDDAQVQDTAGTSAVNYWYADGRFTNRWTNTSGTGEVGGRWRVANDERCTTILSGLPSRQGKEICAPIYRRGETYLSLNPDGSIHGIHRLTPLTQQQ